MDPFLGAGILGGIGGLFGYFGQQEANSTNIAIANATNRWNNQIAADNRAFSSAEALRNRQWQEEMSNTSYQRGMKDMRAAGLNPMLAFMKGGASTPSGSAATGSAIPMQSARVENSMTALSNSALNMANMVGQFKKLDSEVAKNAADAQNSLQNAKRAEADAQFIAEQNRRQSELHPTAKSKLEFENRIQTKYGEFEKWLDMIGKGANSAGTLLDMMPGSKAKDMLWNEWKKYQRRQP